MNQKSHLGGSWAPFGRGLGRPGASFGHSWAPLGRFLGVRNRAFIRHWSKMGSKKPFGSILDGFWEDFGRIWEDLGRVLGGFGNLLVPTFDNTFSQMWDSNLVTRCRPIHIVDCVRTFFRVFSQLRPPRCFASPRGASTMRGGLSPHAC